MNRVFVQNSRLIVLLGGAALCGAYASTARLPAANPTASTVSSCEELAQAMSASTAAKREAAERQHDAWQVVIPFAVVARYVRASAAESRADAQIAALQALQLSGGCDA